MTPSEIGQAIKNQRYKLNISQHLLGGLIERSRYSVERAENYTADVTVKNLLKVLDTLNLELIVREKPTSANKP